LRRGEARSHNVGNFLGLEKEPAVSIRFSCECGRSFSFNDSYAGASIECPTCHEKQTVPPAGTDAAPASDPNSDAIRASVLADAGKKWGSPQGRADEDYEHRGRDRDPYSPRDIDRRLTRESPAPSGGFGSFNAGIGGGLAMMAVGAVIFLVCLGLDRISIYGPILFVIGLIALIKGISNASR
jgi:hypothetical protein